MTTLHTIVWCRYSNLGTSTSTVATTFIVMCVFSNNIRSRDYESLVELGARIGVKIRERDEGSGNKTKVCCVLNAYTCI